jgi:predicted nucleotidyltransferase component of viral defense system
MKKPLMGLEDNRIFTVQQKNFLRKFAQSELRNVFRLTGGTALSAFYLEHRVSEDLDFFTSEQIPFYVSEEFLKTLSFVQDIAYAKSFDRNMFSLKLKDNSVLKVEFTSYPLQNIEPTVFVDNIQTDSFLDIVVNKLCAIADRIEAKDYVDVYCAVRNNGMSLGELINLAEKKCQIKGIRHILKSRLMEVPDGIEKLPMNIALTKQEVEAFFRAGTKEIVNRELE